MPRQDAKCITTNQLQLQSRFTREAATSQHLTEAGYLLNLIACTRNLWFVTLGYDPLDDNNLVRVMP